jgi:phosphatidylglycerol---prolipoprotein diacylglyceryl transferase
MLAWLHWNPQRELFTIPYIDRPIAWYGVFFALGFVIGYSLLLNICRRFFEKESFFILSDVTNWARFLMTLRNKKDNPFLHKFLASLPNPLAEKIFQWDLTKNIDENFQKSLLFGLNHYLEEPNLLKDRRARRGMFEDLFPCCLEKLDEKVKFLAERLCFYTIIGTIVGARLGHIIFYENLLEYILHPFRIFKTWEGGLASHGAVLGIFIAFVVFRSKYIKQYPSLSLQRVLDFFVIPAALGAFFIRIGNFFNQEILGKMTYVPWAIIFGNPADGSLPVPRHPAQLYEACFYLATFILLLRLKSKTKILDHAGKLSGLAFMLVFSFRFIIEFFKEEQSIYHDMLCNMGQLLSLPFIAFGVFLYFSDLFFKKRSHPLFSEHIH